MGLPRGRCSRAAARGSTDGRKTNSVRHLVAHDGGMFPSARESQYVTWYSVMSNEIDIGGESYDGYWFGDGSRILLSLPSVNDGGTVRHEMLHALLHSGAHPVEYFVTRCGALAPCGTACDLSESNRGVPATAREIPSESLSVSVSLSPIGAPAISVDSGWMTMIVTATNARAEPVWVTIPGHFGFGFVRAKEPGTFDWVYEPRWAFRAGESRSLAFDAQLDQAGLRDTLWAFFGNAHSSRRVITVGP